MKKKTDYDPNLEQPFVAHLLELRDRVLRAVVAVLLIFFSLFYFANDIYHFLAEPLLRHMPSGGSMIATEVASPFFTPFKLAMVVSIFAAMPYILYQAWSFIAPGLYYKERRLVFPLMVSSSFLFYAGVAFAYYVVLPLVFGFLTGIALEGVAMMTDIAKYLDFVLKMFFAFGFAFEVPIATILLVITGMVSADSLVQKRPYIIVAAFVIGMLLTPPDVISQTLLAIPIWLLFEVGVFFARIMVKGREEDEEKEFEPTIQRVNNTAGIGSGGVASTETSDRDLFKEYDLRDDPVREDDEEYRPMSQEEMDAELDRIERMEAEGEESADKDGEKRKG